MSLYMGLELQSLSLYVVASFRRDSVKSTEAGMKYFVLGALSSGLLLYGASLVYGYTGSTDFATIIQAAGHGGSIGLMIGLVLVIAGLAFKVSAVPFHMWTPDVYEGSPTPVTAFFATAPKVAAMALFARVMHDAFGNAKADWQQVIVLISLLSMFLGAVAAIGQTNIKRLMAYSSIAHMGYALMGLAAGTAYGVEAMLMYMTILRDHEHRDICLYHDHGKRRPTCDRYPVPEPVGENQAGQGIGRDGVDGVLGGYSGHNWFLW